MSYHTRDKTEAFLPEKGRLMSHVPGMRLEVQEGQELCPRAEDKHPHLQHASAVGCKEGRGEPKNSNGH